MPHDFVLAPSILSADFSRLGEDIRTVEPAVPWVHVDVMDGHYVPNLTIGPGVVAAIRSVTDRHLDTHLMLTDPRTYAPQFVQAGSDSVTFHPEVDDDPRELIDRLHEQGAGVGVALKPAHPLSTAGTRSSCAASGWPWAMSSASPHVARPWPPRSSASVRTARPPWCSATPTASGAATVS